MNRYNSTIKAKKCKCSPDCDRYPTLGCKGFNRAHLPEELRQSLTNRQISNRNRVNLAKQSREVHLAQNATGLPQIALNRSKSQKSDKGNAFSDLLKLADMVFSRYIKSRDLDKNGYCKCICCGITYHKDDKDLGGVIPMLQNMHFIERDVFTYRFSEINCHLGCGGCNKEMHDNPHSTAAKRYRDYMVEKYGEPAILEMDKFRYTVNKISHADLKRIIEKYRPIKK